MNALDSGAEASIYQDTNCIIKDRVKKNYRISSLDDSLRKSRTKKEAKILSLLQTKNVNVPSILSVDKYSIKMSFVKGDKVKNCLARNPSLYDEIGKAIANLHNLNIIHGDLTTSNMLFDGKDLYIIDFGLSIESERIEDKAVDLHLLKQALESYHNDIFEDAYLSILRSYEEHASASKDVFQRLEIVEKRGRNKGSSN